MKRNLMAVISGFLFGAGLFMSQMVNPEKVLAFLDISGDWDPSLMLVMVGALSVTGLTFRFILQRQKPILANVFHISTKQAVDGKLILGAVLFGIGWGMTGYCPGPAIAGLGLLNMEVLLMIAAIYAGFIGQQLWDDYIVRAPS